MMNGAPRLPWRLLPRLARGAVLAVSLVAPSLGAAESPTVTGAEFAAPTTRYNHAVLGPNAEWGVLRITTSGGAVSEIRLPQNRVFEDLAPRLWDLDLDGGPEIVVIEADARQGARLAIYSPSGLVTATPFIGTRYRWLAPLGAADLDGDGLVEIAYIDRPHLAKTLRVWRYRDGALEQVAALRGLTNHKIGEAFISGGIRDCGDGPEIITADASWRRIVATVLRDGVLVSRDLAPFAGPPSFAPVLACE